jgi:hypothetical protein
MIPRVSKIKIENMNLEKWIDRYKTDCALKYNSKSTKDNYISCVKSFLIKFNSYSEQKELLTSHPQKNDGWVLRSFL